jgi:galactose oxidase-like protein/Kelch motif protein
VIVVGLIVLISEGPSSSGGSNSSTTASVPRSKPPPSRLAAVVAPARLPTAVHGATATASGGRLLVIGGADRQEVSTDQVLAVSPGAASVSRYGTLVEALHDAAAAGVGGETIVFGGGSSATVDTVQRLAPGGRAQQIGHLPDRASDLSAASVGGSVYVVGGYDDVRPLASVLRTTNGSTFTRVANLSTPVRYTALADTGGKLYAFGGELASGGDTDEIQSYDPATNRTSVVGHLKQGIDHAAAISLNGTIYLLGGRRNGAATDQVLRFDPGTNSMVPAGHLPSPLYDAAAGVVSGVGYLAGGIGAQGTSVDAIVVLRG